MIYLKEISDNYFYKFDNIYNLIYIIIILYYVFDIYIFCVSNNFIYIMSNQLPPQIVCFVPVSVPTRYMAPAINKSRGLGDDFDVRVTNDLQYNCYFLLEKVKE